MIRYLGGYAISTLIPSLAASVSALGSVLIPLGAEIGRLTAVANVSLDLPDPGLLLTQIASWLSQLPDLIAALPAARASANLDVSASLGLLVALQTQIQGLIDLVGGLLAVGGIHAYELQGAPSNWGSDVSSQLGGGIPGGVGSTGYGVLLVTESGAARVALRTLFGIT